MKNISCPQKWNASAGSNVDITSGDKRKIQLNHSDKKEETEGDNFLLQQVNT